jgi:hypothetical protein
MLASQKASEFN